MTGNFSYMMKAHLGRTILSLLCVAFLFLLVYSYKLSSFSGKYHFRETVIDDYTGILFSSNVKKTRNIDHGNTSFYTSHLSSEDNNIVKDIGESGLNLGYIVALNYYEQQTMATSNLLQLQCFASMLNVYVVQPLLKNSRLITPLRKEKASSMLKMDSVFDMGKWRKYTENQGYAPLVIREEFIKHAPRRVILVQMKYPSLDYIKEAMKNGTEFPHSVSENRDYERGCDYEFINREFAKLQVHNFTLLSRVCYNFFTGDRIPLKVYLRDLSSRGRRVTILMDEWRGIGNYQRVIVDERICNQSDLYHEYTEYSPVLHKNAASYIKRYITNSTSEGYLAVMARFEMTGLSRRVRSSTDPHAIIPYCLNSTLEEIKRLKKRYRLKRVFVSVDIGKYGSKSFVKKKYFGHFKDMTSFLRNAYQGKMSIKKWENSFKDVARSNDAGYIASLQQLLVAKAKCVLFVGGGTFQKHTLHMFQQLHRKHTAMCVNSIKKCTRPDWSLLD